jgi:ectoine hydroxylase-related dioxygenase (phytanoyl-CoA dioxygenase family)
MEFYGVLEQEIVSNETDLQIEQIKNLGYTTLESGFTEGEVSEIRNICLDVSMKYRETYSHFNLLQIGEGNSFRSPALLNNKLLKPASNLKLQQLISKLITGKFYLNQQNLVINPPNSNQYNQLKFHRDLPYQHFISSRPLAINALYAVDDFTIQNGATYVIPASHKSEKFPSETFITTNQKQISVKAGTYLVLDCMLYHAAAPNLTDFPRIGLNHVFTTVMFRPQIDWESAIKESQESGWEKFNDLLGLEYSSPRSVEDYLQRRKSKN